jgi:hypothetical protein
MRRKRADCGGVGNSGAHLELRHKATLTREHPQRRRKGDAGLNTFAKQRKHRVHYGGGITCTKNLGRNPADTEVEGCRQASSAWQRWGAGKSRKQKPKGSSTSTRQGRCTR